MSNDVGGGSNELRKAIEASLGPGDYYLTVLPGGGYRLWNAAYVGDEGFAVLNERADRSKAEALEDMDADE